MRRDNYLLAILEKAFTLAFPSNHPYHFPIIGFKEELASLTAADVKHFYHKYYHPERATLFLVGDLDLEQDVNFVADVFAAAQRSEGSERALFPPVIRATETVHTTIYQEIQMPYGCMYWAIPGRRQHAADVASIAGIILSNGQTGRLQHKLVDELKIADSIFCHPLVLDEAGLFLIAFTPKPGKMEECYEVIKKELEAVIQNGVTTEELQRVVAKQVMSFLMQMESHGMLVYRWIESFFTTGNELELFSRPEKIEAITTADIVDYMQQSLNPFLASTINLMPLPAAAKPLWQDSITKIRAQENAILQVHQRSAPVEAAKFVNSLEEPKTFAFDFPQPTNEFTLPCGLKVLVYVEKKLPIACAQFLFKLGNQLPQLKEGYLVEVMADLLIEGSAAASKKENTDCLDTLGVLGGFSPFGCFFSVTAANFAQAFEQFFRIMTTPKFDHTAFAKIKAICLNNIERQKDNPTARAIRALRQDLYAGTDYAWSFEQAVQFVKDIDLSIVRAKHQEFINPEAMVLSVVGDVDVVLLKSLLERLTTGWKSQHRYRPRIIPAPKLKSGLQLTIPMLRDQAVLIMGRGSKVDLHHPDATALKLLSRILFESLGSRIFELRARTGLFYTASGAFDPGTSKSKGSDFIWVMLNPENVARAEVMLAQMLTEIAEHGVTQEELEAAKQMLVQSLVRLASSNNALASTLAMLEEEGLGFDYYQTVRAEVQALTLEQINAVAKKHCTLEGMAKIQVGGT
jgi:zinc protease